MFMGRRKSPGKLQPLGDVLIPVLKRKGITVSLAHLRLARAWREAVGPRISAQTKPETVRRGVLYVKVSSSAWMQQLHYLKADIMAKLNCALGKEEIGGIFFSLGEIVSDRAEENHPHSLLPPEPLRERERKMIEEWVSCVPDEELRELLRRVMTRGIIRRRLLAARQDRP
jgi:hypothetical protein